MDQDYWANDNIKNLKEISDVFIFLVITIPKIVFLGIVAGFKTRIKVPSSTALVINYLTVSR